MIRNATAHLRTLPRVDKAECAGTLLMPSARRVLSVEDADAPLMKRREGGNPDLDEGMTLQQFLLHISEKP